MAKSLKPLANSNNLSIKNSFDLVDRISDFKINEDDLMLSFDIVSLFTKIPVHVAKSVIFDRLKCDSELEIRCKLNKNQIRQHLFMFPQNILSSNFWFRYGSPIFVIVGNLVMESRGAESGGAG